MNKDFNHTLKLIKNHVDDLSQDLIDQIYTDYKSKTKLSLNMDELKRGIYQYVLKRMGIDPSITSSNISKTVEEVIDEYMVYGGKEFSKQLVNSFDNYYENNINHCLVNFMSSF